MAFQFLKVRKLARSLSQVDSVPDQPVLEQMLSGTLAADINSSVEEMDVDTTFYSGVIAGTYAMIDDECVLINSKGTSPTLNITRGQQGTTAAAHYAGRSVHSADTDNDEGALIEAALAHFSLDRGRRSIVQGNSVSDDQVILFDLVPTWEEDACLVDEIRDNSRPSQDASLSRDEWIEELAWVDGEETAVLRFPGGSPSTWDLIYFRPWVMLPYSSDLPDQYVRILALLTATYFAWHAQAYYARKSEAAFMGADTIDYANFHERYRTIARDRKAEYDKALKRVGRGSYRSVSLPVGIGGVGMRAGQRMILNQRLGL